MVDELNKTVASQNPNFPAIVLVIFFTNEFPLHLLHYFSYFDTKSVFTDIL